MSHKRTRRPQPRLPLTGYCADCDKIRHVSRADARASARRQSQRMRVYICPVDEIFWHTTSWGPQSRVAWYRERDAIQEN